MLMAQIPKINILMVEGRMEEVDDLLLLLVGLKTVIRLCGYKTRNEVVIHFSFLLFRVHPCSVCTKLNSFRDKMVPFRR